MASAMVMSVTRYPTILRHSLPPQEPDFSRKEGIGGRWSRSADAALPSSTWTDIAILKSNFQDYSSKTIDKSFKTVDFPSKIPKLKAAEGRRGAWEMIKEVRAMLSSLGDGEISLSAYDTAWVAMVPERGSSDRPQFPSSLQWIIDNQLKDGSWGYPKLFSAHDRIISTLACSVALRFWTVCSDQCHRGLSFLKENLWRLEEEDEEQMPIGFEVALPSLLDIAKDLDLDFPYDAVALQDVYAKKEIKLSRIPKDVMHEMPTTLLHSLEGMPELKWQKLMKLQSLEGSFLFSPSSTAYALMQTGDEKCLKYLNIVVDKFNGGVPNVYPVDLFEHLWVVDRLQRLGISRYFEEEIKQCLEYVFRYWSNSGICWARNSEVRDIDDTAMGFRLLRLHGYSVSADVFRNFTRDGKFFGFIGQSNQAVTGMYNLNRASQLIFPGEEVLNQARCFSRDFLKEKQTSNQLLDKWVIAKDLPGEVAYSLDFPFYASLPRVETRWYIDHYGGEDVWIGKTLYRMKYVNNMVYLDLAKDDFNQCQSIHQLEWRGLQRWWELSVAREYGTRRKDALRAYFLASASVFEPDRSAERLGWAKTAVLAEAVASFYERHGCSPDGLAGGILSLLDSVHADMPCRSKLPAQLIRHHLRQAWEEWLLKLHQGENQHAGETALLLVRSIELCAGRTEPAGPEYAGLARLTVSICARLHACARAAEESRRRRVREKDVESEMQELLKRVLQPGTSPDCLCNETKRTFLSVVRSFYYLAWCPSTAFSTNITKVLFQTVK